MSVSILEVRDLRFTRGGKTLPDGLSLSLEGRRIYALLGQPGSGKTTLLRILAGLLPLQEGQAEICGVSKTVDPATINLAWEGGIRTLGENRVQELLGKLDALDPRFSIHLIGRLQTNKVKSVIGKVAMIQSLDRDALAEEISRRATAAGIVMPALVQVNVYHTNVHEGGALAEKGVVVNFTPEFD